MDNPKHRITMDDRINDLTRQLDIANRKHAEAEDELKRLRNISNLRQFADRLYEAVRTNPTLAKVYMPHVENFSILLTSHSTEEKEQAKLDLIVHFFIAMTEEHERLVTEHAKTAQLMPAQVEEEIIETHEKAKAYRQDILKLTRDSPAKDLPMAILEKKLFEHEKLGYDWSKLIVSGQSITAQFQFLRLHYSDTILQMIREDPKLLRYAQQKLQEASTTLIDSCTGEPTESYIDAVEGNMMVSLYLDELKENHLEAEKMWDEAGKEEKTA